MLTQRISDSVAWRYEFFHAANCFDTLERLSYITPKIGIGSIDQLFLRRLRHGADGVPYFEIAGDKVYFCQDHCPADPQASIRGALTILKEVYLGHTEFFSEHVQVRPGDVGLDLGGNFGTSAMTFSRRVGPSGHVYSFEPVFAEAVRRTAAANGLANVSVVPMAVWDAPGEVDFCLSDIGIDSRVSSGGREGHQLRVPAVSLDVFAAERGLDRIDFIKADIEGAEEWAIRGATRLIERCRPAWSIASYHTDPTGEKQHRKLVRLLRELGYTVDEIAQRHIFAY